MCLSLVMAVGTSHDMGSEYRRWHVPVSMSHGLDHPQIGRTGNCPRTGLERICIIVIVAERAHVRRDYRHLVASTILAFEP